MRALLLLAVIAFAVVVLWPLVVQAVRRRLPPLGSARRDELVKDPVCQTYVVMSRAVRTGEGASAIYFCSRECAARYTRGERRA